MTTAQPNKSFPVAEKVSVKDLDEKRQLRTSQLISGGDCLSLQFLGKKSLPGPDIPDLGVSLRPPLGIWGQACLPLLGKCNP